MRHDMLAWERFLAPEDTDRSQAAQALIDDAVAPTGVLGVAFSGGVDSAVVVALAVDLLGADRVMALLGVSASLAQREEEQARALALRLGVRVIDVPTRELDDPDYVRNGPDRCYFCKDELFSRIDDDVVVANGIAVVAYGENADDRLRPDRPGARAATEHRVIRPLADAGLDKAAIRRIARAMDLPVADKPAAPCLASRIPHFTPVTRERLAQVEAVEDALHALGFPESRARHHGETVRIEVPLAQQARIEEPEVALGLRQAAHAAGFTDIMIDPHGLTSGADTMKHLLLGTR